jgi:hypothetical protein
MSRSALAAFTVVALGVPLSGCGGEPARAPVRTAAAATPAAITVEEPAVTARVTDRARRAYIRRADRVCADLDPQRESKLREVEGAADPEGTYADTVTLAAEQLRRIAAIEPPAADRSLIGRNVIDRLRERLALRERLERDLAAADATAASRDQVRYEALGVAVRSFARGYGFRECGKR